MDISNILVIRNDRFGEFLLNIPAIKALKDTYPRAKLVLAVNSLVYELALLLDCVDEVVIWDKVKNDLGKYNFDLSVVFNPTKEAHWLVFRAQIPLRVGYARKCGFLLTHKLRDIKHLGDKHEVDYNLELVGLVGAQAGGKDFTLRVNENYFLEYADKKVVAVHAFTSDLVKQWPKERFLELAQRINHELKIKVVLVGLALETLNAGDIIDLTNKTSLPELASLLKRCALLVSGDSGPVHLAASVGTPVIALFRNDLPGKTAKRWGPWGQGHLVIERSSLNNITVEEVLNQVKEVLKK